MSETNQGNIIRELHIGNTHIKISDQFCRISDDKEINAILNRISKKIQPVFSTSRPPTVSQESILLLPVKDSLLNNEPLTMPF